MKVLKKTHKEITMFVCTHKHIFIPCLHKEYIHKNTEAKVKLKF